MTQNKGTSNAETTQNVDASQKKNDFLTRSIEQQGLFFHQRCKIEINNNKIWKVAAVEHPYYLGEKGGRIDLVAIKYQEISFESTSNRIFLVIECKRANPDFKTWVFFPEYSLKGGESPMTFSRVLRHNDTVDMDSKVVWYDRINYNEKSIDYCYDALEVRLDSDNGKSIVPKRVGKQKNTTNDEITKASNQATSGTLGFAIEERKFLKTAGREMRKKHQATLFIPVIVTTAALKVCDFEPQNVDISTGTLKTKGAQYRDVKWLIHQAPLEPGVPHTTFAEPGYIKPENRQIGFSKEQIFVVQSESFKDFMDSIGSLTIDFIQNAKFMPPLKPAQMPADPAQMATL